MVKQKQLLRFVPFGLVVALMVAVVSAALAFPSPNVAWLAKGQSYSALGTEQEAIDYYATFADMNTATLPLWKTNYGFPAAEVNAIYYNAGDLGFGRNMHCRKSGADVACYVANHGFGPASPPTLAVDAAINGESAGPVVAMVYHNALNGTANDVTFYIYESPQIDPAQSLINKVPLDSEGEKFLPRLCLSCHGGTYDTGTKKVSEANFLPFDTPSFRYSAQSGYTLADQVEKFRELNAMVRDTNPTPLITELIDGWYSPNVYTAFAPFDDNFVPSAYNGSADDIAVYEQVVKPYCRACHISQGATTLEFPSSLDSSAQSDIFDSFIMPHAQLTSHNFWSSDAPATLADNRGWSIQVTNTNDSGAGSLRQAVADANASGSPAIITFADGLGTITLTSGQLSLSNSMTILGRGASQTTIDGNNASRVFLINTGANVTIKGVTIRGGNVVDDHGAGIYNGGGTLNLLASTLKNNTSTLGGGGIFNLGGTTTIVGSTIGPNNSASAINGVGGGVFNFIGGTLTIENSTVSGNTATWGGGLFNLAGSGVMTATHTTIINNSASSAGGGVYNGNDTTLKIQDSIVSGNSSPSNKDCAIFGGSYNSLGYNLVGSNGNANGCPTSGTDNIIAGAIDTVLNTNLVGGGSGVPYHALIPDSPAIDADPLSTTSCLLPAYDQRNIARPLDGDANGTAACDIGAREFVRVSLTEVDDVVADDGLCSLREAVMAANTGLPSGHKGGECPGSPDVIDLTLTGPYGLANGQLDIYGNVTIEGHGQVIERATGGVGRIFFVNSGGNLNLHQVTVQKGLSDDLAGGGIRIDNGGVANILNSAIINNMALPDSSGGGILNEGALNMANSTLSGNQAGGSGGGISIWNGVANLVNVTISNNLADVDNNGYGEGGGLAQDGGITVTVKNSLIAGNFDQTSPGTVQPDVAVINGLITTIDYNLIGDNRGNIGTFAGTNDQVGVAPLLDAQTGSPAFYPLQEGSPAIDQIPPANCQYINSLGNPLFSAGANINTDQRGAARPVAGRCDIGAFEFSNNSQIYLPIVLKR